MVQLPPAWAIPMLAMSDKDDNDKGKVHFQSPLLGGK